VDVEEFGRAAVEADALALVELALPVVVGHALLGAGAGQSVATRYNGQCLESLVLLAHSARPTWRVEGVAVPGHHVCHHLHLSFGSGDLLGRRRLWPSEPEKRHVEA